MSITDELREWAISKLSYKTRFDELSAIADRIDAEHERKMAEFASGWDYWESTHVELPKDADGEYIHIGDVMENLREDLEPQLHHTFRVYGIHYRDYGQGCSLTEDGYPTILYRASECRHYHAPAIEDVLRKCIGEAFDAQSMYVAESMGREEYEGELERLVEKCAEEIRKAVSAWA